MYKKHQKKGQITIFILLIMLVMFIALIFILVGGIVVKYMNSALDIDVDLGQVNLREYNAQTMGQVNTMYVNNADWWGMSIIFGMIIGLFLSAYFTRNSLPKLGLILDIFIIITMTIMGGYFSASYSTILDSLAQAGETFLEDVTPKTSMFMLNLPIFIPIIGVIMMIIFHSSIPRRSEERAYSGGYLQGAY